MGALMDKLTAREQEVVSMLMQGKRPKEITSGLCIQQSTLKMHLRNARFKAGARTTIELVAKVAKDIE